MKKRAILLFFISFFLFCLTSPLWAAEVNRLDLILKDGKVTADLDQVPLKEVLSEIEKKWRIKVEVYGQVDKDRLLSAKFEALPLHDSLYRLFRGINFSYIEGEKICLLGFGEPSLKKEGTTSIITVSSTQGENQGKGSTVTPGASGSSEGTSQPIYGSNISGEREWRKGGVSSTLVGNRLESMDQRLGQSGEIQSLGTINQNQDSKSTSTTSFTTPIILEAGGQAVSALSNDLAYDPSVLSNPKAVIAESGKQAGKEVLFNEVRPGLLRVGVVGLNQTVIPDGTVVNVTFDVLKGGQITITSLPTASDPHGNMIPVRIQDGKIKAGN